VEPPPSSAAPASAARLSRLPRLLLRRSFRRRLWCAAAFLEDSLPVRNEIGHASVNLEPGQRVAEDAAVCERALHARRRREVLQAPLHADDLAQALDIAPREWQVAEPRVRRSARPPVRRL
jgi:hypothetical protein